MAARGSSRAASRPSPVRRAGAANAFRDAKLSGYREFDSAEVFDADGTAAPFLEFAELAKGWQASREGRFTYSGKTLRASFGWNAFIEDGSQSVPFATEEGTVLQCLSTLFGAPVASRPFGAAPCVAALIPGQIDRRLRHRERGPGLQPRGRGGTGGRRDRLAAAVRQFRLHRWRDRRRWCLLAGLLGCALPLAAGMAGLGRA